MITGGRSVFPPSQTTSSWSSRLLNSTIPVMSRGCHLAAGNVRQHPHHLSELPERGFHVAQCAVTYE